VIGGFYIGECYCILHELGNEKENLAVFDLADFHNSSNHQSKFYAKFSSCMVCGQIFILGTLDSEEQTFKVC